MKKSPPSKRLCSFEALSTHRGPVIFNLLWSGTPPVTVPSRAHRGIDLGGRFLRAAALHGGSRIFHTPGSPGIKLEHFQFHLVQVHLLKDESEQDFHGIGAAAPVV